MFHSNSEKDYEKSFWWWAVENFWMPSRASLGLGRHPSATLRPRFFFDWKLSAFVDTSAITYYINTNPELEITKKSQLKIFEKLSFFLGKNKAKINIIYWDTERKMKSLLILLIQVCTLIVIFQRLPPYKNFFHS